MASIWTASALREIHAAHACGELTAVEQAREVSGLHAAIAALALREIETADPRDIDGRMRIAAAEAAVAGYRQATRVRVDAESASQESDASSSEIPQYSITISLAEPAAEPDRSDQE